VSTCFDKQVLSACYQMQAAAGCNAGTVLMTSCCQGPQRHLSNIRVAASLAPASTNQPRLQTAAVVFSQAACLSTGISKLLFRGVLVLRWPVVSLGEHTCACARCMDIRSRQGGTHACCELHGGGLHVGAAPHTLDKWQDADGVFWPWEEQLSCSWACTWVGGRLAGLSRAEWIRRLASAALRPFLHALPLGQWLAEQGKVHF
jgi:hypothetical protein